jgi:hypothetical protein
MKHPLLLPPPRPSRLAQPGKKTVTFSAIVRFVNPPQRDDFEKKDLKSLWYNKSEMIGMKMHDRITINLMRKGTIQPDDDLDYCFRGLECRVRAGATQRKRSKFIAALTMILEQDRQWVENDYDVELLADRYFKVSYDSFCNAYERAIKDEKEARAYHANPFPEVVVSNPTTSDDSHQSGAGNHAAQEQLHSSSEQCQYSKNKKNARAA